MVYTRVSRTLSLSTQPPSEACTWGAPTPTAASATANTTDPTSPDLAQLPRPLAHTQLRVVADADETDNSDPHYNAESMANAPTTPATSSTQPDKHTDIAHPPDLDVSTPTADCADIASPLTLLELPHTTDEAPDDDGESSPRTPTGAGGPDTLAPPLDVWQTIPPHLLLENEATTNTSVPTQ